ncbi:MAG: hypothetical protein MUC52_03000 [Candidatus Omnitrophica bacterium]|nr:hypothetical protein [Candidatus Omnitrophota bacterium]
MIEINLLPDEMRAKQSSSKPSQIDNVVYLFPVILAVVLVVHLYLGMVYMVRAQVLGSLERNWRKLEPQRQEVTGIKSELDAESSQAVIVGNLVASRVLLAPKLNKLSYDLPPGIWFNEVIFDRKELKVKASVVSLKSDEMDIINTFLEELKNDKDFNSDFSGIEVGALQRKTIGSYDVVDFVLTASVQVK